MIPIAVYEEVIKGGIKAGYADAILLENLHKNKMIDVKKIRNEDPELKEYLHQGEYESIQLASELGMSLIIDDSKARMIASIKEVNYKTTIQIMLELLEDEFIDYPKFERNLLKYGSNSWILPEIIEEYNEKAKELLKKRDSEKNE
ncbi:MAG: hypothetical protein ACXQS8_07810 [Candidatus Helarchaeales archaeon]